MKVRQSIRRHETHPPTGHEVEFKLAVPLAALDAVRVDVEALHPTATHLVTHYADTADGRLAAAGLSLRLRQQGEHWAQTLKAAGPRGAVDRLEETIPRPHAAGDPEPQPDPSLHRTGPAAERLQRLLGEAGSDAALVRRFTTDVLRRSAVVRCGDSQVELALDEGCIRSGVQEEPLHELEIELKQGHAGPAAALASERLQRHGLWLMAEAKATRGERLAQGQRAPAVTKATPPALAPQMSAPAMLRTIVGNCLQQVLPNASAVAAGIGWSDEHVHQLRVGLRRLRTAMRELDGVSKRLDPAWEVPLADAFRALGVYRDGEIVRDTLPAKLRKAGAPDVSWTERPVHQDEVIDPVATARTPAFQTVLLDLLAFVLQPPPQQTAHKPHLRRLLKRRLRALHSRVTHDGERFQKLATNDQHKVRKRLKRLRYLSEFAAPLYGQDAVDHYLDQLHPAQDALGAHHDRVLAAERAGEAAAQGDAGADFAVHWLAKRRKKSARKSHRALHRVSVAQPFWRRTA